MSRVSLPARAVWWNHGAQIAEGDKYSLVEDHEGRWDSFFGYREGETVELSDQDGWIGQILFIQYGIKKLQSRAGMDICYRKLF